MLHRRIWLTLLAAMLCFQLSACRDAAGALPVLGKTVGICVRQESGNAAYYAALADGIKAMGYSVVMQDSQNDQSRQNQQVSQLIADKCDLLVIEPVMVSALENVIGQLKQAQLPAVIVDRQPDAQVLDSYDKLYFVGCDSAQAGTAQAALLNHLNVRGDLNGDGTVSYMMLRGPQDHLDAQLITDSCNEALASQDTQLLCTVCAQWDLADSRAQCSQYLAQYGKDIEVIFCNDAQLAQGAVEAVKNGGWTPGQDVYILAVGTNPDLEGLIAQGTVAGTVVPDTTQRSSTLPETVKQLLSGKNVEKIQFIPYVTFSAEG